MDFRSAISSIRAATTTQEARSAHELALASPDLEDDRDFADMILARKLGELAQREAIAKREEQAAKWIEAMREKDRTLAAHKRKLIAELEAEIPGAARSLKIRVLRAEVAVHDVLASTTDEDPSAAQAELQAAKWARRCYRYKTGGRGPLGGMTNEDHLMRNPYTGRRE